jgi:HSP20 family protein
MAERSLGSFERSVRLPDMIDDSHVEARFNNGVLKITVQKKPEAIKAEKKIEIRKD